AAHSPLARRQPPISTLFPYTTLFRSIINRGRWGRWVIFGLLVGVAAYGGYILGQLFQAPFWLISSSEANQLVGDQLFAPLAIARSEEHTSELQSRENLVCRLLLEKKK